MPGQRAILRWRPDEVGQECLSEQSQVGKGRQVTTSQVFSPQGSARTGGVAFFDSAWKGPSLRLPNVQQVMRIILHLHHSSRCHSLPQALLFAYTGGNALRHQGQLHASFCLTCHIMSHNDALGLSMTFTFEQNRSFFVYISYVRASFRHVAARPDISRSPTS